MDKIKLKRIMLFILVGLWFIIITLSIIWGVLKRNFMSEIYDMKFDRTTGEIINNWNSTDYPTALSIASDESSWTMWIFGLVITIPLSFIFIGFALLHARPNSQKKFAKWPYIVMIIVYSVTIIWVAFDIYKVSNNEVLKLDNKQVQASINNYLDNNNYKTLSIALKIPSLVIRFSILATVIYILKLTINLKSQTDIEYSEKVKDFGASNPATNNLP